jgi:hypothetical protein
LNSIKSDMNKTPVRLDRGTRIVPQAGRQRCLHWAKPKCTCRTNRRRDALGAYQPPGGVVGVGEGARDRGISAPAGDGNVASARQHVAAARPTDRQGDRVDAGLGVEVAGVVNARASLRRQWQINTFHIRAIRPEGQDVPDHIRGYTEYPRPASMVQDYKGNHPGWKA